MKKKDVKKALGFLTLAMNYHHLAESVLEKIEESNIHIVFGTKGTVDRYGEITKWSDFRVLIPTLFLFYHGLELQLKGLLAFHDKVNTIHSLQKLLSEVKKDGIFPEEIINVAERHIDVEKINIFLKKFITDNKLSVDDLYMALRYPTDRKLSGDFSYLGLKYKEDKIIPYVKLLIADCKILNEKTGEYYSQYRHLIYENKI